MEILRNKIVDVSTPKKTKKVLKVLKMFNQNIAGHQNHNQITYFPHVNEWHFVTFKLEVKPDLLQPSELKKILAKELLKAGDVVIVEGHQPKKTRWIACIKDVEYYSDAGLKFITTEATCLNNPSYRSGSAFAGKFKRFATTDEVAKLVEEIAINTCRKHSSDHFADAMKYRLKQLSHDPSLLRKTTFIPFGSFYSQVASTPPLPPFLEVLKKDVKIKREQIEKELSEFQISQLPGFERVQHQEISSTLLSKIFLFIAKNSEDSCKYAGMQLTDFKDLLDKDFMSGLTKVLSGLKDNSDSKTTNNSTK